MTSIESKSDTFKHFMGLEVQSIGTSNKAHGKRNVGSHAQTQQNEDPLLSVDDMLVDFATSDIQCMYFYMSSIIS